MTLREQVVAEARSWIGTPYHHLGNIKGPKGGVDCGMIIVEIMSKCGVFPWFDPRPYSRQFHLHKDVEWYKGYLQERGRLVSRHSVRPGDVALFKIGRLFSHGSILTEWPSVVHAVAMERCVLEMPVNKGMWKDREVLFFDCIGGRE